MSRKVKIGNMIGVWSPFVGFVVAIGFAWGHYFDLKDAGLFALFYLITGFGITLGFHRLLTHKAFETYDWLKYLLAILGSMAWQGAVISWLADHRKHHKFSDVRGDPHSPHLADSAWEGLKEAHVGWITKRQGLAEWSDYAKAESEDPVMRRINKLFPLWLFLSVALPTLLGWWLHGDAMGAARGFVWGGLVRIFILNHVTWSINSVCHYFGERPFKVNDMSTNFKWLWLPSLGESWHHNHHAFPRSGRHGLLDRQPDPTGGVIDLMEYAGLAWNVYRVSPESQRRKLRTQAA